VALRGSSVGRVGGGGRELLLKASVRRRCQGCSEVAARICGEHDGGNGWRSDRATTSCATSGSDTRCNDPRRIDTDNEVLTTTAAHRRAWTERLRRRWRRLEGEEKTAG
jgi:hypothetical protein